MNLDEAINKHAEWKVKFRVAMTKKEQLDAAAIRADNRCDLGKWLHGEGQHTHGSNGNFANLVSMHADFHRAAGKVAEQINGGSFERAEAMLGNSTEYALASANVAAAITRLKKDL